MEMHGSFVPTLWLCTTCPFTFKDVELLCMDLKKLNWWDNLTIHLWFNILPRAQGLFSQALDVVIGVTQ